MRVRSRVSDGDQGDVHPETGGTALPGWESIPVGVAWIGLDRTGYGIHGTPLPENVGRTESHGCFRLANWDAAKIAK